MRPRVLRTAAALALAVSIVGASIAVAPASAYSCAGPDRADPAAHLDSASSLFTGTVVGVADDGSPPILVTFGDVVVWKGEAVDVPEIDIPVAPLYDGELQAGDRVHVFLDDRGRASGCDLYNATGGAIEMMQPVWPELDLLLAGREPVTGAGSAGSSGGPNDGAGAEIPGGWLVGVLGALVLGGALGTGITLAVTRSARRRSS